VETLRTAICISGQLRTYRACAPALRRLVADPLGADVFVHAWDTTGLPGDPPARPADVARIYGARSVQIERFDPVYHVALGGVRAPEILRRLEPRHVRGALPLAYGLRASNGLKQAAERADGRRYDLVIRLRPDIRLHAGLHAVLLSGIRPGRLWQSRLKIDPRHQVSDKFLLADSRTMDRVAGLLGALADYWTEPVGDGAWRDRRVGERLMRHHTAACGLEVRTFDLPAELLRPQEPALRRGARWIGCAVRGHLIGTRIIG
jgi:hypothetical protein